MSVITVNRQNTYGITVRLAVWECPACGVVYGIPEALADACRADGSKYYCPNGHSLGWQESDAERERKRADVLQRRLDSSQDTANRYREKAEQERRTAIALRGHLTRIRRRIANGVCPVPGCKRSGFKQVMAHIASQHADWLHEHPDVVS